MNEVDDPESNRPHALKQVPSGEWTSIWQVMSNALPEPGWAQVETIGATARVDVASLSED